MFRYIIAALLAVFVLTTVAHTDPRRMGGLVPRPLPVGMPFMIPFCGNGGNDTDAYLMPQGAFRQELSVDSSKIIPFCGQGGDAATRYIGPVAAAGDDITPGGATCDGMDEALVADADELPWGDTTYYKVTRMQCQLTGGVDDTVDMTLYDDTVSVSALTCEITADGGTAVCSVHAEATLVAGSLLAIEAVPDDDNLSAADFSCALTVTLTDPGLEDYPQISNSNGWCSDSSYTTAALADEIPFGLEGVHYWIYAQYCQLLSATTTTPTLQWVMVDEVSRWNLRTQITASAGVLNSDIVRNDMEPIEVLPGSKLAMSVLAGGEDLTTDDYYCVLFATLDHY